MSILGDKEIPVGLGMALAQNLNAMQRFSSMTEEEKRRVVEQTHSITSKQEMQRFVSELSDSNRTY